MEANSYIWNIASMILPLSIMRLLARCFYILWFSFLLAACFQMHRAESWSHIKGLNSSTQNTPNLVETFEQSLFRKDKELVISEETINTFLAKRLAPHSLSPLGDTFKFEGAALDFENDVAKVHLKWRIFQRWTSTASLSFQIHRTDRHFMVTPTKGKLGRLPLTRGLARLLTPVLDDMVEKLNPELTAAFQMQNIIFARDKVIFHPISEAKS